MPSRRLWALAAAGVFLVVAGAVTYLKLAEPSAEDAAARKLLQLSLPDPAGKTTSFQQWTGRVLLANFWATWCAPCREEVPALVAVQSKYAANGVQVVGIAVDSADKVREFAEEFRINYPLVIGGLEAIAVSRDLGNRAGGLPFSVILDRNGKLAFKHLGGMTRPEIERAVEAILR